jgi:hypothetical protein
MARANLYLIQTIREAAKKLQQSTNYQWGHMGSCNCGFLAQEVTRFTKAEIHKRAMARNGDWNEQLNEYCPTSGLPMDDMISELLNYGFDVSDLKHLERLSDSDVLKRLPANHKYLRHNQREDVVLYMRTWADMLEEKLLSKINLPHFYNAEIAMSVA